MKDDIAKPEQLSTIHTTQEIDGFITMNNTPMPEPDWTRLLDRQSYTQPTNVASANQTISIYENGIVRVMLGLLPDGTYGMVVSKPGSDVRSIVA